MAFRIGQRVRIVGGSEDEDGGEECVGDVATVVSTLLPAPHDLCTEVPRGTPVHILDIVAEDGGTVAAPPCWLAPIDDGRSPIAWTAELLKLCRVGAQRKEGV